MAEELLTREEAADFLNISTRTLDRYVKKNIISTRKQGRRTMFLRKAVEAISKTPSDTPSVIDDITQDNEEDKKKGFEALVKLAQKMHDEIQIKDKKIETLTFELGRQKELTQSTIPMLENKEKENSSLRVINSLKLELEKYKRWRYLYMSVFGVLIAVIGLLLNFILS